MFHNSLLLNLDFCCFYLLLSLSFLWSTLLEEKSCERTKFFILLIKYSPPSWIYCRGFYFKSWAVQGLQTEWTYLENTERQGKHWLNNPRPPLMINCMATKWWCIFILEMCKCERDLVMFLINISVRGEAFDIRLSCFSTLPQKAKEATGWIIFVLQCHRIIVLSCWHHKESLMMSHNNCKGTLSVIVNGLFII